jgi:ATP-dependent helicase HrpB
VVTEGVLTRRLQQDPELPGAGLIIFDEVHERNLQTDLGLALSLDVRKHLRPDLRLLAMSATLDATGMAEVLGDEPAPVISADVRPHPVEIRWLPLPRRSRFDRHVAAVVRLALEAHDGDVLVFLPGIADIRRVAGLLEGTHVDVRMLHGSLPFTEQDAAIAPSEPGHRKVVLSTDIAETSLTVEGVRIVIDGGAARVPRFDARTGMTRLRTVQISRSSAEQRAGRAGRTEPGVAYRLWSKVEHAARKPYDRPEIAQVDLASLALELAAWGTTDPAELPFPDQPPARTFAEGRRLLMLLGALDADGAITDAGRRMAALPLHPRLARMVIDAGADQSLACVLAAMIDDRDVLRGRPDELPIDVAVRVGLIVDSEAAHPAAQPEAIRRVRRNAEDLARRALVPPLPVDVERSGAVLALAFPDRLAVRRGSPGRFQLRTGTTAWTHPSDPISTEQFLVPADLDGRRKDARIRLAAAIDAGDVAGAFAHEVEESSRLVWDGGRLVERRELRLGGLVLDLVEQRAGPGPASIAAITERLRRGKLADLSWSPAAVALRDRVRFLRGRFGDVWPDWSREVLASDLESWLGPYLHRATSIDDLQRLDLASILRRLLPRPEELERLAPVELTVPSGRRIRVDYSGDTPVLAVRVQEMFGSTDTPTVAGVPVVLQLLSPADRPLQITQDLAGFWSGSWRGLRREMAGRYPKHDWPEDPATARPSRR